MASGGRKEPEFPAPRDRCTNMRRPGGLRMFIHEVWKIDSGRPYRGETTIFKDITSIKLEYIYNI